MKLTNGIVIDNEKTFGTLKFSAVRDVYFQNEDGTVSGELKKRVYDLKCNLHGGMIQVSVPAELPVKDFPYNSEVVLVNPVVDTVANVTYRGTDVDWYVKCEDIVLKGNNSQSAPNSQNHKPQEQRKKQ